MIDYISNRDHRLMKRVNRWSAPRWIRLWMICATRGGDGWLWYVMCAAVAMFGGAERFAALLGCVIAVGAGIGLFLWLKRTTGRRRPCHIEPHAWATLLPPDQFSFPSGHTITAFAMATTLSLFYPSLMAGLLFCAISIAASRILLGMHFLSDVVVGALIGSALGYAAVAIVS
jgi:undecaprenyl-diphosphatase